MYKYASNIIESFQYGAGLDDYSLDDKQELLSLLRGLRFTSEDNAWLAFVPLAAALIDQPLSDFRGNQDFVEVDTDVDWRRANQSALSLLAHAVHVGFISRPQAFIQLR